MNDGEWIDVNLPGRGVTRMFRPFSASERKAAESGMLSYSQAAVMLGRSRGWVKSRVEQGLLRTCEWMGEKKIWKSSVERALASMGFPSADEQTLERLEEAGRHQEAFEIRERMQAKANAAERAELGGQTVAEIARAHADPFEQPDSTADRPSVTESILARLRRGK